MKMKKIIWLLISLLLISCSATSEEVTISSNPATVAENALVIKLSKPIRTTKYPFNLLLIAVPATYKLDPNVWMLVAPNGNKIKVEAVLKTSNGIKTRLDNVSFLYGDHKQYLALSADTNEKLKDEYFELQISSSKPFLANEIKWLSTSKL